MFQLTNHISEEQIEEFCMKNHIKKLSLFGSASRNELQLDSDIDILVEFEKEKLPGC